MTAVQFVDDLGEELKVVLSHMQFPDKITGKLTGINIFTFGIPVEKTKENKKKKFPYALIIPKEGNIEGGMEPQIINVQILIGVYDDDIENQGKRHVLNIIHDICERFQVNPVLKNQYYADEKITWVVDDEEEHPYHFGAVWLTFNTPSFRRENEYA